MVEYLKTIGEELSPSIQQLASGLQDIIQPNYKYQSMLKDSLAKNPELIGHLATIAKDNPGALESIFGKNSSAFFSSLHEGTAADLARKKDTATAGAIKGNEQDVGRVALGLPTTLEESGQRLTQSGQKLEQAGQATRNQRDAIALSQETSVAKMLAGMPEEQRNDVFFKQLTGMLHVDYDAALRRGKSIEAAAPWKDKSTKEIWAAYKKGQIGNDALEGLWDTNPGAMKMMLQDKESDQAWAMRAAIAKDAQKNRRLDIMGELYKSTAVRAHALGVKPAALFEAENGYAPKEVVPNAADAKVTPEDIAAASKASTDAFKTARSKALIPVLSAKRILDKSKDTGSAALFNAAADAAGIDISAEKDNYGIGGMFSRIKYFSNGQEIDDKAVDDIMSGKNPVHTGITPPPKPTVSPQEESTGRKVTDSIGLTQKQDNLSDSDYASLVDTIKGKTEADVAKELAGTDLTADQQTKLFAVWKSKTQTRWH